VRREGGEVRGEASREVGKYGGEKVRREVGRSVGGRVGREVGKYGGR